MRNFLLGLIFCSVLNVISLAKPQDQPIESGPIQSIKYSRLFGKWINVDPKTDGITTLNFRIPVDIPPLGAMRIAIQAFTKCQPMDCDLGFQSGYVYATSPTAKLNTSVGAVSVAYEVDSREILMIIHPKGEDYLEAEVLTIFKPKSGQVNYRSVYTFKRAS